MAPLQEAARLAAATVLSGPAGGIAGSRRVAELIETRNLVPFDMGGTSTDISLIEDGEIALSAERGLAGQRIALRSLDIASIGAGGGSIAYADAGGTFHVGPRSAGSVPGRPATAMAGRSRPSPTRTCCSAISAPRPSWVGVASSTQRRRKRRSTGWPPGSASTGCTAPPASTG